MQKKWALIIMSRGSKYYGVVSDSEVNLIRCRNYVSSPKYQVKLTTQRSYHTVIIIVLSCEKNLVKCM